MYIYIYNIRTNWLNKMYRNEPILKKVRIKLVYTWNMEKDWVWDGGMFQYQRLGTWALTSEPLGCQVGCQEALSMERHKTIHAERAKSIHAAEFAYAIIMSYLGFNRIPWPAVTQRLATQNVAKEAGSQPAIVIPTGDT